MKMRTAILALACLVLANSALLPAQQKPQISEGVTPTASVTLVNPNPAPAPPAATAGNSSSADPAAPPAAPPTPQAGGLSISTDNDDQWHLTASPYLWLPGVHGTIGAFDREAGFKASPSDLLSHFDFGLLGLFEARRNRLLANVDTMWMRLSDNTATPFGVVAQSVDLKANMFIITPKVGFRLVNQPKLKADFLAGFRYWYFNESLSFNPIPPGPLPPNVNFSRSQSWVDPLVGGRIEALLAPKILFTMAGDVGGWGTGSQLEYQVVGLLGYKLTPKMTLQGGYRYMYFDYQKNTGAADVIKTAFSGVLLGVTLNLK